LAVVVLVLLTFTGLLAVNSLSIVQRVTFIDHIRGTVEAKEPDGKQFRALTTEARVLAGTVLRTGKNGEALLHWADGTRLQAGPETTLTILKCRLDKRTQAALSLFRLDVGQIFIRVVRSLSANSKFEIRTPTATAGVRGTEFALRVLPDGYTEVLVYEGKVAVATGSQELGVTRGEVLAVSGSQKVTTSRKLNATELAAWERSDASKPFLSVTSPKANERFASGRPVVIRGVGEPGSKLTIGGRPVTLGADGSFSYTLPSPQRGPQTIPLEQTDPRGVKGTAQVTIQVE
jgi:hypothetical protein